MMVDWYGTNLARLTSKTQFSFYVLPLIHHTIERERESLYPKNINEREVKSISPVVYIASAFISLHVYIPYA